MKNGFGITYYESSVALEGAIINLEITTTTDVNSSTLKRNWNENFR
jgi:hypothetical protein